VTACKNTPAVFKTNLGTQPNLEYTGKIEKIAQAIEGENRRCYINQKQQNIPLAQVRTRKELVS